MTDKIHETNVLTLHRRVDNGADRALSAEIEALGPWFHNLHLPGGVTTCPGHYLGDFPAYKWRIIADCLPERLDGWRVLDIGCNAGFYSFELAKRGADVTGIDVEPLFLKQARWAAGKLGLEQRVRFREMQVYDLAHTSERYDLVLFLGVFYHLRYPLLGLDIVSRLVRRMMVFQTMMAPGSEVEDDTQNPSLDDRARLLRRGWPKMAFIENALQGDRTNWWVATHAAVEAMLRTSGLRVTARPEHEVYVCVPDPNGPSNHWRWNAGEYAAAVGRREGEQS
jgi:tRNA (mo5U34)-methyltransferase